MSHKRTFRQKIVDRLYDHPYLKRGLVDGWGVICMALSAFIFAFGFKCFLAPNFIMTSHEVNGVLIDPVLKLVSGGLSGISQVVIEFIELVSNHAVTTNNAYTVVYSLLYFGLNIPIFFIAFFGIGKRFGIMTAINVIFVAIFNNLLALGDGEDGIITQISYWANANGGLLSRAIFGGVCTGLSSALAYKMDASAGGIDVIAYWVALRKRDQVGRYSLIINAFTVTIFTILSIMEYGVGNQAAHVFVASLFSVVYLLVVTTVIDMIDLRNKKIKITVVSDMPDLGKIIISNIPHGATMVSGKGVFSSKDKFIIDLVVSSYEVKHTVKVIREADPKAFVEVMELKQVFGRFHLPPIR